MQLFFKAAKRCSEAPGYKKFKAYLLAFFLGVGSMNAQEDPPGLYVIESARAAAISRGAAPADLADLVITDRYQSTHNGITHVYLQQRYQSIPVYNALGSIHLDREGKTVYSTQRFLADLAARANAISPKKDAQTALISTFEHLGIPMPHLPVLPRGNNPVKLEDKTLSRSTIPLELVYLPQPDNSLKLCWQVGVHDLRNQDYHVVFVDAENGQVLNTFNRTIYCHFGTIPSDTQADCDSHTHDDTKAATPEATGYFPDLNDRATYRVFKLPLESPSEGTQTLVVNPADPKASPFGWHDVNGIPGAEYTTTRGNNTFAYLDRNNDDSADGNLPDGGPELIFDFPFSSILEPIDQPLPSVTQLFYLNNVIHDLAYQYGFNEAAGNFQENNYSKGGKEKDAVMAQAQDGGGVNNANFLTLPDGDPGVMQMYLWTPSNDFLLRIESPSNISGLLQTGGASFGPLITSKKITGRVVAVVDSVRSNLACSSISNIADVRGNIALITRGTCTFKEKTLRAAQAGAIGVIIANNQDQILTMGGDNTPPTPTIPAVLIKSSDAARIQAELNLAREVSATIAFQGTGPALRDASMDNGITAHEYAHGISNRLTAGPSKVDCLFNDEAMGEGWSDFFTLVMTVKPGQTGKQAKGIGTYSLRQGSSGTGIRRMPYSTDFKINNQVYNDIIGTRPASATTRIPHPVGEIWAATLWDLYWEMSSRYGWDPDLVTGKGGNNKAIQLVMDGMKLQPCNPGFVDGRDAILAADKLNYNGDNQCLIWEVFARRGIGFSARQGSTDDRNDGLQAFDLPPACRKTVELHKSSTPAIQSGEPFEITLQINNYKDSTVTDLWIQDMLPDNTVFVAGSVKGAIRDSLQNNTLWLEVGLLSPGTSKKITYQLRENSDKRSTRTFSDDMEQGAANWTTTRIKGENSWVLGTPVSPVAGSLSWNIPAMTSENDHVLQLAKPLEVLGTKPVLRFFHRYFTQETYDGGIVEYAFEGSNTWTPIHDSLIFRQPYARPMLNNAFGVARVNGFSGAGPDSFRPSYIDLSTFKGRKIQLRFRFATNQEPAGRGGLSLPGWSIDLVELLDVVNLATEACAYSKSGDRVCAMPREWGTIIEPGISTNIQTILPAAGNFRIFPNPARDFFYLERLPGQDITPKTLELFSPDGRKVMEWPIAQANNGLSAAFPLKGIPPGVHFLRIVSAEGIFVEKMVIY
jgi:extracellular elastinolytic metalloproteinase